MSTYRCTRCAHELEVNEPMPRVGSGVLHDWTSLLMTVKPQLNYVLCPTCTHVVYQTLINKPVTMLRLPEEMKVSER